MKTKPLLFVLSLTFLFLSSCDKKIETEQDEKSKESSDASFIELSIANHINQFQSCGFNRDDIKVKKSNHQSKNIIAYVIHGSPGNLECLISKKSKITKETHDNYNLIFFQSLHDDNSIFEHPHDMDREISPLKEGLIKFDDRFIVFTAPGSEGGVVDITKVSSGSFIVNVSYPLSKRHYLASFPLIKITHLISISYRASGGISIFDKDKLLFKASLTSGWIEGGHFNYDALIDQNGERIDIINTKNEEATCYPIKEFLIKSGFKLPKTKLSEVCVMN